MTFYGPENSGPYLLFPGDHAIILPEPTEIKEKTTMSNTRNSRRQNMTRMIALIIAGVMVVSVVAAALLSQMF